jgi:hypothetical protein
VSHIYSYQNINSLELNSIVEKLKTNLILNPVGQLTSNLNFNNIELAYVKDNDWESFVIKQSGIITHCFSKQNQKQWKMDSKTALRGDYKSLKQVVSLKDIAILV